MANRKSTLTLAKDLGFHTVGEYYAYITDSYINGNLSQCRELFNAMREKDRKEFLKMLHDEVFICLGEEYQDRIFNFLF
jgi:hypothetical protein